MQQAWDKISAYLTDEGLHADDCHLYGPWAPSEAELQLLGPVKGLDILEIGCGAGQCSIALAAQGAHVTGLDPSAAQLDEAQERARDAEVAVRWLHGAGDALAQLDAGAFDRVIANYSLPYVNNLSETFAQCARLLKPDGRMVFAMDHPLRTSFYDEADEELLPYPSRSYFDTRPFRWRYAGPDVYLDTHHRTVAQWLDLGHNVGLRLLRLVEPPPPQALLDEIWPEDDFHAPLRNLPQAIIFVLEKG